jgi:hypothetical protein
MSLESPDNTLNVRNAVLKVSRVEMNTLSANTVTSDLTVSGNVQVGTANLFVDTVSSNVGIGTNAPMGTLDVKGVLNHTQVANVAQITSNSNVVMEYRRSKKLIKYPRVAMTSASSGGYTASASSVFDSSYPAWEAFNNTGIDDIYDAWLTPMNRYTLNNYIDVDPSVAANINGVYGEWLELKLPHKITLDRLTITSRAGSPYGQPGGAAAGNVWGSNDGVNWILLTSFTGLTYGGVATTIGIPENVVVNSTTPYSYFRLQPTKRVGVSGSDGWVGVGELQFFGLPEYDPEAHGTDVTIKSVPNVPNTDWLEVYYDAKDLADGSTTVNDLKPVGTAVNGTVGGNTTVLDGAFTFDEAGDYIEFTTGKTGNYIFSVSVWFKSSGASIETLFHMNGDYADNNTVWLHGSGTSLYLDFVNNQYSCDTGITIADGNWHHASFVYNGNGQSGRDIYFDGKRLIGVVGGNNAGQNLSLTSTSSTSRIGALNHTSGIIHEFKGSIANFRLYNRALSADEIWELYAYQKEYFGVSPDVVTLKAGRVGIGTSEPKAVLDVNGLLKAPGVILNVHQFIDSVFRTSTTNTAKTIGYETPAINVKAGSKIKVDVYIPWRFDYVSDWCGGFHYIDFKVNKTVGTVSAGTYVNASDSGYTMMLDTGAILNYTNSFYLPFSIQEDFTLNIRHRFMRYHSSGTLHVNGSHNIGTDANLQQFFGNDFGGGLGFSHYIITEIAG